MNLVNNFFKSFFSVFIRFGLVQILSVLISIFILREITPGVFGVYSIILLIIINLDKIIEFGLSTTLLIKKNNISSRLINESFSFIFIISILFSLILFIIAFLDIIEYEEINIRAILLLLSSILLTKPFRFIPSLLIKLELKNYKTTNIDLISNILYLITVIVMFSLGYSIYSLAIGHFIKNLFEAVLINIINKRKYSFVLSKNELVENLEISSKFLISSVINSIHGNVIPLLITSILSIEVLGIFTFTKKFVEIIIQPIRLLNDLLIRLFSTKEKALDYSFFSVSNLTKLTTLIALIISSIVFFMFNWIIENVSKTPEWGESKYVFYILFLSFLPEILNHVRMQFLKVNFPASTYLRLVSWNIVINITLLLILGYLPLSLNQNFIYPIVLVFSNSLMGIYAIKITIEKVKFNLFDIFFKYALQFIFIQFLIFLTEMYFENYIVSLLFSIFSVFWFFRALKRSQKEYIIFIKNQTSENKIISRILYLLYGK